MEERFGGEKLAAGAAAAAKPWNGLPKRWIAATAQQLELLAERRGQQLRFRACAETCGGEASTVSIPMAVEPLLLQWTVLTLRDGKRLLHGVSSKVVDGRVFQLLVAAASERKPTVHVLFADWTVLELSSGSLSAGEKLAGRVLRVKSVGTQHQVLTGRLQPELSLCGRSALLNPQLLVGKDLSFHGAKLQRLSLAERRGANQIAVKAISDVQAAAEDMYSGVLRAIGASSGQLAPSLLTDGDLKTGWAEARGADGRGEFVVFEVADGASLQSVDLLIRGRGVPRDGKVGPRRAWLATSDGLFALEFGQDGWDHPGQWYRAEFEPRLNTSCLALVLETGYRDTADVEVSLTEVRGVSPEAAVPFEELVERLGVQGPAGDVAEYWLSHRGSAAVDAVASAFTSLRGTARERAWRVLTSGPCAATNPALATILSSSTRRDRERATSLLRRCSAHRTQPLQHHFDSMAPAERLVGLGALASLEPAMAARFAIEGFAGASSRDSRILRDVLARATRSSTAVPVIQTALAETEAGTEQTLHILRALSEPIVRFEPEVSRALHRATTQAIGFREKYLLLEPIGVLLSSGRPAFEGESLTRFLVEQAQSTDPYLRARATELLPASDSYEGVLLERLQDPNPRVRQAAVTRSVSFASVEARKVIVETGLVDEWPFVRLAAVAALAQGPSSQRVDQALWRVFEDDSAVNVRSASIRALATRGASHLSAKLVALFADHDEAVAVRVAAAGALGALCVQQGVGVLLDSALALGKPGPGKASQAVGRAALRAVVRLQPPGLQEALRPLLDSSVPAPVRQAVRDAEQISESCRGQSR